MRTSAASSNYLTDILLTFWHRSFTVDSNKSPTWCNNFSVYYPDVYLELNMFRAFSRPSSGAQWLQWRPLVLPSYRGDSRAVFVVGPAGRHDHEHSISKCTRRPPAENVNTRGCIHVQLTSLTSWRWAYDARNMYRNLILCNLYKNCVSSWYQ